MEICITAMFNVPNGSEPKKEMNIPVKNMRPSFDMQLFQVAESINF